MKNWINPEPNKLAGLDNVDSNSIHNLIIISSPEISGNTMLSNFNFSGEKVMERQLNETETQLDISALPRAVYFVSVRNENLMEVGKMVKE